MRAKFGVSFYAKIGEHGEVHTEQSMAAFDRDVQFRHCLTSAQQFKKRELSRWKRTQRIADKLEMIEVQPYGDEKKFAILYITDWYLNNIIEPHHFKNPKDYEIYVEAAKRYLSSGRYTKGYYL